MKKEKKDKDFVKSAYFEGGRSALDAFFKKELQYPKEAMDLKVEGRVSVRYIVDYKGKVVEANVISGIGHGCDEEALRIVRKMPFKVPEDGKIKSKYSHKLHIHFRLPGRGVSEIEVSTAALPAQNLVDGATGFQYNYQLTVKPIASKPTENATSSSYQISINFPLPDDTH